MKITATALMATLLVFSALAVAFPVQPVQAAGTIYIRPDGSVEPSGTPLIRFGNVYIFTDNISGSIEVQRGNIIVDGNGFTLHGLPNATGLYVSGVNNVTVSDTTITSFMRGIWAVASHFNTFSGNWLSANNYGIYLYNSSYNSVWGNSMADNAYGIGIYYSVGNSISGNVITSGDYGIYHFSSSNSDIAGNTIAANSVDGIYFYYSYNSSIVGNTVTINEYGIFLIYASNNQFYHNNLVNNTQQVSIYASGYPNTWDDGYPSGGNHWSDYTGIDVRRGATQDLPGSDGIGDTPYGVGDDADRYPLMGSYGPSTPTGSNVTVFPADDVCIIFEIVTTEGLTIVEKPGGGPTPPPGVSILQYYVIETTADYAGQITIKIVYNGPMGMLANPTLEDLGLLQVVMLVGDVDEDFDVDIFDLVRMAGVYGVAAPDPRYDANCDVDRDGDIDIFDVVQLAGNYGEVWQPETGWDDITTWFDPETNSIFGVTQHLSIFGVT